MNVGRLDDLLSHLPPLYREGELIRGMMSIVANQLEIGDEVLLQVRRAHGFDTTFELEEAAKLAALLDLAPAEWQDLPQFRAWVHHFRNAMLQRGAVTVEALQGFVTEYAKAFARATGTSALISPGDWSREPNPSRCAFIENPKRLRVLRAGGATGMDPLGTVILENSGLDETPVTFLLRGLAPGPEYCPSLFNLTTGEAVVFLGAIPTGARLWIAATKSGEVAADLEGADVSNLCYSVSGVTPGSPWSSASAQRPARALTLARGTNELWFLPLAHFDAQGLDRFLLALAGRSMSQGRFDASTFDEALFLQEAAIAIHAAWIEREPAAFEIHLPAGSMLSPQNQLEESLQERVQLAESLSDSVARLRAAGVRSSVELRSHQEFQIQRDRLSLISPVIVRETGSIGADRMPDAGGLFEITHYDESTYR